MPSKTIPLHSLGKNGPTVPAIGLGLMGLSIAQYGGIIQDDEARFDILDRAVDLGNTFWDTSDLYGDSEELLGKWFKRTGKRDQIFLATKFGFVRNPGLGKFNFTFDSSAKYCKESCERSLKTMGVGQIDLYYLHHANAETPIEETMRALAQLQLEGKIKNIGLSNVTSSCLRRAVKIAPVAAVQVEYSAFTLDIEQDKATHLLQTCRELGVSIVCYSPLGRGLLTSTFTEGQFGTDPTDMRPKIFPRLRADNRETNVKVVQKFAALAEKKSCTVSQLALAWLVKQGEDVIPIPGTKKVKYLEENWDALDVKLSDEEEKEIRKLVVSGELHGHHTPEFEPKPLVDTKEDTL